MTIREELHQLVDELPERSLVELRQLIEDLKAEATDGDALTPEMLAAVHEGIDDIKAGRTVTWEQVKGEIGI